MSWQGRLPAVRGKLLRDEPLGPFTWFRVGGPADVLFLPADADDLTAFLLVLPDDVPVTLLGVGSNVIVRDAGVDGVVIRLAGRAFGKIEVIDDQQIVAGVGALDAQVARAAAKAGIAGLEFYAGIPGSIGGALKMNAGCYGSETKDVLVSAWGVDRTGELRAWALEDFEYRYRHSVVPDGMIFTDAVLQGRPDDPAAIQARMDEITARREQTQPIREKTGGSTFKNPAPPGHLGKLWSTRPPGAASRLEAPCSRPLHANFLINTGEATAADLEGLGEAVRADVKAKTGIVVEWEIKRIGRP